jgi:hypothetical protein
MANLASRTTSGDLAWDKYVKNNKSWNTLILETEKDTNLLKKSGVKMESLLDLPKGSKFSLQSNMIQLFNSKRYASVKIDRKKGYIEIKDIRKPTNFKPTGYEEEVVSAINNIIKNNQNLPIDIKLKGGNKVYKGISGAIQVNTEIKRLAGAKSDPKADIILYVDKKNLFSPNNIFISHKKEGGPEAFQQYGGLSEASGLEIYNHPEVKKFLKQVASFIEDDKLTKPLYKDIKNNTLKNMSIFGPGFSSSFGIDHVTLIGQGLPKLSLTKKENLYELDFTSHISLSGNLSHFKEGYTPVFGATFRAGRGFSIDGKRYNGARVGIYPKKLIETRTGAEKLK